jgi:hypothetical protein
MKREDRGGSSTAWKRQYVSQISCLFLVALYLILTFECEGGVY